MLTITLPIACSSLKTERTSRIEAIEGELLRLRDEDTSYKVSVIGEVEYRGRRYPILAAEHGPAEGCATRVLNIGGIHGGEAGGVEAVYRMMLECRSGRPGEIGEDDPEGREL